MAITKTLESVITVAAGVLLIVISGALAADHPKISLIIGLFLVPMVIAGINHSLYGYNFTLTVAYNFGLVILNDLFIRTYLRADGIDDTSLVSLTFFVTLAVSLVPMLLYAWETGKKQSGRGAMHTGARCVVAISFGLVTALAYYMFIG